MVGISDLNSKTSALPSVRETVRRCCVAGLTLACTGKPVLHAYAGPMGLLSFGFGATGVAIGHSQNLWKFTRDRWMPAASQGGGGDAPARFFSKALWGTIIYPDETSPVPCSDSKSSLDPLSLFRTRCLEPAVVSVGFR